jgi:hypothetical protein
MLATPPIHGGSLLSTMQRLARMLRFLVELLLGCRCHSLWVHGWRRLRAATQRKAAARLCRFLPRFLGNMQDVPVRYIHIHTHLRTHAAPAG